MAKAIKKKDCDGVWVTKYQWKTPGMGEYRTFWAGSIKEARQYVRMQVFQYNCDGKSLPSGTIIEWAIN